ncbi:MAG: porin [Thermodesulfobacteriota bacterium]
MVRLWPGPDAARSSGSDDNRLEFDLTRFVLELEGEMYAGLGFEAEIEFEHGGTGSTFEIEYEEFGEYEQETEKGGEVYVEELYLYKKFGDWGKLKAGRFYLAFGLMSFLSKPTDYLAARRPSRRRWFCRLYGTRWAPASSTTQQTA